MADQDTSTELVVHIRAVALCALVCNSLAKVVTFAPEVQSHAAASPVLMGVSELHVGSRSD